MRKALIREIAPDTVLDWIEAEEYVMSQYQLTEPVSDHQWPMRGGVQILREDFRSRVHEPQFDGWAR
jgi:hypothetical protein